ncbi:MAG TPA: PocR ligand-binding domain-containing protein, partial [Anaerolineae bacterium]
MEYRFADLVDVPRLQAMLTSLHPITGLAISLVDADGVPLASAGGSDICSQYHRACPLAAARCQQSDQFLAAHAHARSYVGYECLNGLMHYASPVILEGQPVAALHAGQIFHQPPDEQFFRQQAQECGFDTEAYVEALHRVPVIPKEQCHASMTFLAQLADSLASFGLESLRLRATTTALAKSDAEARRLGEELEQRVDVRTAELAAANLDLSRQEAWLKQAISTLSEREGALSAQIA